MKKYYSMVIDNNILKWLNEHFVWEKVYHGSKYIKGDGYKYSEEYKNSNTSVILFRLKRYRDDAFEQALKLYAASHPDAGNGRVPFINI